MPKVHRPRAGSLQFWPRKKAKKIYPNIKFWKKTKENKILGFIGYKVGMTLLHYIPQNPNVKKNLETVSAVTILECPPLKPFSLRFYKNFNYGSQVITEILSKNLDKELSRKIVLPKKQKDTIPEEYDYLKLLVYTQPKLTGIGKKKPELFEILISGKDIKEKFEYAKSLLDKEIKIQDIFKDSEFLDVHSITIGKGLQGPIKRFGISLKSHKSEKKRRAAGNLGAWTPKKVSWTVPQKGQMGYQTRTEYNKLIIKVGQDPNEINQKGGFLHYGDIKNPYLIVKGSISGPTKRIIRLVPSIRGKKPAQQIDISYISKESKQ